MQSVLPAFRDAQAVWRRGIFFLALSVGISRLPLQCAAAAPGAATITPGQTACCSAIPRIQDQLWLVQTHHLKCPVGQHVDHPAFRVLRHEEQQGWSPSSIDDFLMADDPEQLTCIYVHGARVDTSQATQRGWRLYRALLQANPSPPSIRFVIYVWPTPNTRKPLRDFRTSSARGDLDAYYLGWLLAQIQPEQDVSMIGYSFGARIIFGALHVLGGGELAGARLPDSIERPAVRAVVWAAAVENAWLLPGRKHDEAMSSTERLLIYFNPLDPVLRRFRLISDQQHACALGYAGLAGRSLLGEAGARIEQQNACCQLGRTHQFDRYFGSYSIRRATRDFLLGMSPGERARSFVRESARVVATDQPNADQSPAESG